MKTETTQCGQGLPLPRFIRLDALVAQRCGWLIEDTKTRIITAMFRETRRSAKASVEAAGMTVKVRRGEGCWVADAHDKAGRVVARQNGSSQRGAVITLAVDLNSLPNDQIHPR